ncbi:MAG TPA: 3-hydroxyacyl-CoA dehydrogenase NAD-binding domain-containing protein [Syntrophales bacterium]|nr:3-hydroxyacyl-CoA dehydrogenase NAD-binding domain-containing protein [Syntrophales bacterium]
MAKAFTSEDQGGIAVIRIDVPGEAVNTWTNEAISGFEETLAELEKNRSCYRGVVFYSGKATGFHAGANLDMLGGQTDIEAFRARLAHFNDLFGRLENLGIPTVAAISGPCMGGGYEFALAMTARISANGPRTLIGLPECNVGVIPGGGGTQRLPRLIGLSALQMIVRGAVVPAGKALEAGLVDRVCPEKDDLVERAKAFAEEIARDALTLRRSAPDLSGLDEAVAAARALARKASRGRDLPAPRLAIRAVEEGLKCASLSEGLKIETECFLEVLATPECKGSINTFFLKTYSDKPLTMIPKGFHPRPLKKLAVLGFGTMGRGIIIDMLRRLQVPVVVKDLPETLEPGKAFVKKILEGMAEKGQLKKSVDDLMGLLKPVSGWTADFADVDLVVEAVFEDPAVKDEVYGDLCRAVPEDCLIVSNTSSLPVDRLARSVTSPKRFLGTHFFSPVWRMELLEIIRGKETTDEAVYNLLNFAAGLRKRPIVCNDNPGFVVNAMLFPYFIKAYELLGEGVPMDAVDNAMMRFGLPVGPIRLTDEVGIDVSYLVLTKSLGRKAPMALENVYKAGRFGRNKNGKGFYTKEGAVDPEALPLVNPQGLKKEMTVESLQEMLFLPFVETGKELLEKGVVKGPRAVDIGAIWGIGFPADKGGPLKWADLTGLSEKLYKKSFYKG